MRALLLAGLLAVTAACGAYGFPGQSGNDTGNVHGTVRVHPCAPVEQQGQMCKGLPGVGVDLLFSNGSEARTATVDSSGGYSIDLPAGTWKVTVVGPIARIVSGPSQVSVPGGGSIEADYVVDSGIRVPAAS